MPIQFLVTINTQGVFVAALLLSIATYAISALLDEVGDPGNVGLAAVLVGIFSLGGIAALGLRAILG